jgi:ribosomal protein S18 acetylase RimI-like enzyme
MIDIRLADLSDPQQGQQIVSLLDQYARHPMGGGEALPEFTRKNLAQTLAQRKDCYVILAYDEQKAIGLCNCFECFSTFACKPILNIHDVYVADGYRGQGVATRMMQHAEQLAHELDCCKLTLEVLTHNEAAKASYRSSGYAPYQLDDRFGQAEFWQKSLKNDEKS